MSLDAVPGAPSLEDLARKYGSDKQGSHSYAQHYGSHFAPRRSDPITLLEIGVGGYSDRVAGGGSLRMWKEYFPSGRIVGIDYYDKRGLSDERVVVLQGDQSDRRFLHDVGSRFGPFDFVIDDGSHICQHVITSFDVLFEYLKDDGMYVIEDLQTSYWGKLGGSRRPNRAGTTMTLLKRLADGLNYAEFDIPRYRPTRFDRSIVALTFYHNIVFIQKGPNVEPSNILPPHPRPGRHFRSVISWRLRLALKARADRDDRVGNLLRRPIDRARRRRKGRMP
jgi:hypothetical protein